MNNIELQGIANEMLESQKKEFKDYWEKVNQQLDHFEPFAWMDEDIKQVLTEKLTPEEMQKLDRSARNVFAGQRVMTRALQDAFSKCLDE